MKPFVTALLALAIAACGTGKAIFNVDAYSFMSGTGRDTIHYIIRRVAGLLPRSKKSICARVRKIDRGLSADHHGNANLFNTGGRLDRLGFSSPLTRRLHTRRLPRSRSRPNPSVASRGPFRSSLPGTSQYRQWPVHPTDGVIRIAAVGTNGGATPVTAKACSRRW